MVKAIQKYKPYFFIGVPTMFVALSNLPDIHRYDLSSLKGIFVGAAPLTRAIKEDFEAKTGARMIEGYGLTESVTAIMANPYQGMHKVGSIGIPFPDVEVKIVSLDDGHDLPPGELGEIVLTQPNGDAGLLQEPEETRKTIAEDGWLYTGDIGYMDEDGYFYITDRKKELIIVGGFNVFPREIDELIYQHPKVKEGITVGHPRSMQRRAHQGLHRPQGWRNGHARRIHRLLSQEPHTVQSSIRGRVPHRTAQEHDRQNPAARTARRRDSQSGNKSKVRTGLHCPGEETLLKMCVTFHVLPY